MVKRNSTEEYQGLCYAIMASKVSGPRLRKRTRGFTVEVAEVQHQHWRELLQHHALEGRPGLRGVSRLRIRTDRGGVVSTIPMLETIKHAGHMCSNAKLLPLIH